VASSPITRSLKHSNTSTYGTEAERKSKCRIQVSNRYSDTSSPIDKPEDRSVSWPQPRCFTFVRS
jgi:hypothetical protein